MAIVLTRVDGRLIHGQVAVAWTRNVNAEKIIVIDDETADDEMQSMLVELAAPSGAETEIYNLANGIEALKNGGGEKQNTMLIIKKPDTVLALIERGIQINSVNIGGMYYEKDKVKIDKALFVDKKDQDTFKKLQSKGVELFYQVAPLTKKQPLFSLLH